MGVERVTSWTGSATAEAAHHGLRSLGVGASGIVPREVGCTSITEYLRVLFVKQLSFLDLKNVQKVDVFVPK